MPATGLQASSVGGYIEPDTDPLPSRAHSKNTSTPARRKNLTASASPLPADGRWEGAEDCSFPATLRRNRSDECFSRDAVGMVKRVAGEPRVVGNAKERAPSPPVGVFMARSISLNDLSAVLDRSPLAPLGVLPCPILKRQTDMNAREGKCVCWDETLEQIIEYTVDLDACMDEGNARRALPPEPLAVEGRLSAYYERSLKKIATPSCRTNPP